MAPDAPGCVSVRQPDGTTAAVPRQQFPLVYVLSHVGYMIAISSAGPDRLPHAHLAAQHRFNDVRAQDDAGIDAQLLEGRKGGRVQGHRHGVRCDSRQNDWLIEYNDTLVDEP